MINIIKTLIFPRKENILVKKQVISLEDNKFSKDTVFFSGEGDCVQSVVSTENLYKEHLFLIGLIRSKALNHDCFIDFDVEVLPVIRRFISIVACTPCEYTLSNIFPSKLIHKTLVCILKFSEIYLNSSRAQSSGAMHFFECLYLVLTYSLYKFSKDFYITTPGKKFEFILARHDSLEEFIAIHKASHLRFFRKLKNEDSMTLEQCFSHLLKRCPQTLACLKKTPAYISIKTILSEISLSAEDMLSCDRIFTEPSLATLFSLENSIKDMLITADNLSSYLSMHKTGFFFDLGLYIRRLLSTGLIDKNTEGAFEIEGGFFIEEGSPAHNIIYKAVEQYYSDISIYETLRKKSEISFDEDCFNIKKSSEDAINSIVGSRTKQDFYNTVLSSEYLFSNLYKKKSDWYILYRDRNTCMVKGFELYFYSAEFQKESHPHVIHFVKRVNDPLPILRKLRELTNNKEDPSYIQFKKLVSPIDYFYFEKPLEDLIVLDSIKYRNLSLDEFIQGGIRESDLDSTEDFSGSKKGLTNKIPSKKVTSDSGKKQDKKVAIKSSLPEIPKVSEIDEENAFDSRSENNLSQSELNELERDLISSFNAEHSVAYESVNGDKTKSLKNAPNSNQKEHIVS